MANVSQDSGPLLSTPVPRGPDGSVIPMEFFPSEENEDKCKELGVPLYDPEIHVRPPSGYFKGSHIKLYWEADELQKASDRKRKEADSAKANPELSKESKSVVNYLDKFLELKKSIESQGGDTSELQAKIMEAMGLEVVDG